MIGKFMVQACVSLMSLIHPWCESRESTLTARTFTFRLANSLLSLATAPSSVVQTGGKSGACEKSTPQPSPSHWWKSTSPSVVCAVKFGAVSPNLVVILLLLLLLFYVLIFTRNAFVFT